MTTYNFNLKVMASAVAALALTLFMSWTFVDATSVARVHRDGSQDFVAAVSTLVR
jgi:hypothetical protein